jgi:hypothetical protein
MAVTIDTRPTYFGDRMVVTGTYAATDTTVELSGLLASIDAFILNPTNPNVSKIQHLDIAAGTSYAAVDVYAMDFATVSGTTVTIGAPVTGEDTVGGTWLAIGRRS